MNVVKGNYTKENNMATQMVDLQKLKAICLEKVIEHLQEEVDSESVINSDQAKYMLDFIGSMLINELVVNKEVKTLEEK